MNLVNEIRTSPKDQSFFWRDGNSGAQEVQGDDVKGAFLALLQGLVGLSNVGLPSSSTLGPEVKAAKLEEKAQDVQKEAPVKQTSNSLEIGKEQKNLKQDNEFSPNVSKNLDQKLEKKNVKVVKELDQSNSTDVKVKEDLIQKEVKVNPEVVQLAEKTEVQLDVENEQPNRLSSVMQVTTSEVQEVQEVNVEAKIEESSVELVSSRAKKNSEAAQIQKETVAPRQIEIETEIKASNVKVLTNKKSIQPEISTSREDAERVDLLEEISSFIQSSDQSEQTSNLNHQSKDFGRGEEKMHAVRDALLARLLVGANTTDVSSAASLAKQGGLETKSGSESSIALNLKSSSQQISQGRTASTQLIRRGAQSQEFVDKVKEVLEKSAINKTNDSMSVKIDPPHLGEIRVKVTHKNGEIFAKLSPENKEIEQILRSKVSELNAVIQALGFEPDEIHVQIGNDSLPSFENSSEFLSNTDNQSERENKKEKNVAYVQKEDGDRLVGGNLKSKQVLESGWVA